MRVRVETPAPSCGRLAGRVTSLGADTRRSPFVSCATERLHRKQSLHITARADRRPATGRGRPQNPLAAHTGLPGLRLGEPIVHAVPPRRGGTSLSLCTRPPPTTGLSTNSFSPDCLRTRGGRDEHHRDGRSDRSPDGKPKFGPVTPPRNRLKPSFESVPIRLREVFPVF